MELTFVSLKNNLNACTASCVSCEMCGCINRSFLHPSCRINPGMKTVLFDSSHRLPNVSVPVHRYYVTQVQVTVTVSSFFFLFFNKEACGKPECQIQPEH